MARSVPVRPFASGGAVLSIRSVPLFSYSSTSRVFSFFWEGGRRLQVFEQLAEGEVGTYPSRIVPRSAIP